MPCRYIHCINHVNVCPTIYTSTFCNLCPFLIQEISCIKSHRLQSRFSRRRMVPYFQWIYLQDNSLNRPVNRLANACTVKKKIFENTLKRDKNAKFNPHWKYGPFLWRQNSQLKALWLNFYKCEKTQYFRQKSALKCIANHIKRQILFFTQ